MPLLDSSDPRPVHFMGIAGAGMSGLAELFVRRGIRVTGCDNVTSAPVELTRLGIAVTQGHAAAHVADARAVVVTSAVPRDHPELEEARARGLPVIRRAEALAEAVAGGTVVGIAGTHGKTTTTVMTTEALSAASLAPTGIVGGRVDAWGSNLRYGGDRVFVVEADEYDRSFLALTPHVAAITNIEADHLDIYQDLDDILSAFTKFAAPARGIALCSDDSGALSLPLPDSAEVIRYGIEAGGSKDARLLARELHAADGTTQFEVELDGDTIAHASLRVPGRHNVRNALAAIACGLLLGADAERLCDGLANFRGVDRRFQRLGDMREVTVVDDYAHHPSEIAATLQAARELFPDRRVIAAFQPHLFSRTRDFSEEFGLALAAADEVYLTEIYAAREQPIEGVTTGLVGDAVERAGREVAWRGERAELAGALASSVRPGDVVLTMGAGDITRTGPELLARLAEA